MEIKGEGQNQYISFSSVSFLPLYFLYFTKLHFLYPSKEVTKDSQLWEALDVQGVFREKNIERISGKLFLIKVC